MFPPSISRHLPIVLAAWCAAAPVAFAGKGGGVVYVDRQATGAADGKSWGSAFTDLQAGLAAAVASGAAEVWVAEGTYTPAPPGGSRNASFALQGGLGLYGGFPSGGGNFPDRDPAAHPTLLSGDLDGDDQPNWVQHHNDSVHVVTAHGVGADGVLDGFTIRDGYSANGSDPHSGSGGGLLVVGGAPLLRRCTIRECYAGYGGGLLLTGASAAQFVECTIEANLSQPGRAGGAYVASGCDVAFRGTQFLGNLANGFSSPCDAGAMFIESGAVVALDDCLFRGNRTVAQRAGWGYANGGAIANLSDSLSIRRCTFEGNGSESGGALWNGGDITVSDSRFSGNEAQFVGGAVTNFFATASYVGCTVVGNEAPEGGGMAAQLAPLVTIDNCLLWSNVSPGQPTYKAQWHDDDSSASELASCCVEGLFESVPGEDDRDPADFPGCIDADPLLVDADGPDGLYGTADDDLRLGAGSPCIDAGDDTRMAAASWQDAAGAPREQDDPTVADTGIGSAPLVDIGALEAGAPSPWSVLPGDLPGLLGAPLLEGVGTLAVDTPGELRLHHARPGALALLLITLQSTPIAFKGGLLLAWPAVEIDSFVVGADGSLVVDWDLWPDGAQGQQVTFQYALLDASAIKAIALSNALQGSPQ